MCLQARESWPGKPAHTEASLLKQDLLRVIIRVHIINICVLTQRLRCPG